MRVFHGAGHEQFTPSELLAHARLAEEAKVDGVACSDHFQPWWSGADPEGAIRTEPGACPPRLQP